MLKKWQTEVGQDEYLKEAEGQQTGQSQTEFDTLYLEAYRIAQELEIDEAFRK